MRGRQSVRVLGAAGLALVAAAAVSLRAQPPVAATRPAPAKASVQDALTRLFHFRFAKPTPIDDVASTLGRELGSPVVLDRAAVDRLGLKPDDTVQLELDGVRLKTGLKLLLDQLDMTFKVEPDDNLLILTDHEGAADPISDVLVQLKSLHRDVHDLQDAVDEIRAAMGLGDEGDGRMRKPTIIEELPAEKEKPKDPPATTTPPARSRSGL